jgi:hypothetical protein
LTTYRQAQQKKKLWVVKVVHEQQFGRSIALSQHQEAPDVKGNFLIVRPLAPTSALFVKHYPIRKVT